MSCNKKQKEEITWSLLLHCRFTHLPNDSSGLILCKLSSHGMTYHQAGGQGRGRCLDPCVSSWRGSCGSGRESSAWCLDQAPALFPAAEEYRCRSGKSCRPYRLPLPAWFLDFVHSICERAMLLPACSTYKQSYWQSV